MISAPGFTYLGCHFTLERFGTRGSHHSSFNDHTATNADFKLTNLDNGKTLEGSFLHCEIIERYGFYEGHGTKYRMNPEDIIAVFDFIRHPTTDF